MRRWEALVGLAMVVGLGLGSSATASAQQAIRTYVFEPVPFSASPESFGRGQVVRSETAAIEARDDVRLLRGSAVVSPQDADVDLPTYSHRTVFRFRQLEPQSLYTIVGLGLVPDDPNQVTTLCRFVTDRGGSGECYSQWDGIGEPAVIQVRRGAEDGVPVLRSR